MQEIIEAAQEIAKAAEAFVVFLAAIALAAFFSPLLIFGWREMWDWELAGLEMRFNFAAFPSGS